jgi:segregation and condensation protein B
MQEQYLKNIVEAALLAAGRPLTLSQVCELFEERDRPADDAVRAALEALSQDYAERGIEVRETASGWRIQIRRSMSDVVSRLWTERPARYSRAMLETLALIAYRQPITRAEIEEIRGVAVNPNIIRTMVERNWLRTVGYREVPGRPELLGTTREFLDYFNLKSLEDLPTLAALRDMDNVGVQLELPQDGIPAVEQTAAERDDAGVSAAETAGEAIADTGEASGDGDVSDDDGDEADDDREAEDDAELLADEQTDDVELSAEAGDDADPTPGMVARGNDA